MKLLVFNDLSNLRLLYLYHAAALVIFRLYRCCIKTPQEGFRIKCHTITLSTTSIYVHGITSHHT